MPFVMVGVPIDQDKDVLRRNTDDSTVTWTVLVDHSVDPPVSMKWDIKAIPTFFIIDADGIVRREFTGAKMPEIRTAVLEQIAKTGEYSEEELESLKQREDKNDKYDCSFVLPGFSRLLCSDFLSRRFCGW